MKETPENTEAPAGPAVPDLDYSLRPLFDELHDVTQAAISAMHEGDMQEWLENAAQGAQLQEEIAVRLGWRETMASDLSKPSTSRNVDHEIQAP